MLTTNLQVKMQYYCKGYSLSELSEKNLTYESA